jgi:tryptophan synthase alpha chain
MRSFSFFLCGLCEAYDLCGKQPFAAAVNSGRISRRFEQLAAQRVCGFIAYVTAGDPSLDSTLDVAQALEAAGVDVIELGIPFSDPLADGPTIQAASNRALAAGMTVSGSLELVRRFRENSELPLVLFTYLNPIYSYGFKRFLRDAVAAGADGLLILDLPPEEAEQNSDLLSTGGLDPIRLVAPTTPPARMAQIVPTGRGFIYYVSREGVTGEQSRLSEGLSAQIGELRKHTSLPIAVGFGISTAQQAATVARQADAVVVGSAIVRQIAEIGKSSGLAQHIHDFVRPLVQATKSA